MRTILLSVIFCFTVISNHFLFAQTVTTQYGDVQGVVNGTVHQFLGIPFASPPIDTLRWKAPLEPNAWSGVLIADEYAPVCPQKKFEQGDTTYTLEGEEDCLYLNIWTPQAAANLPVMVFIHGGGNQQGGAYQISGGTELYSGKNMAERGEVVVVTIQYRLGPLGFLVHPGLEEENASAKSGNYAVLDQILALSWVKNNISAFGGDPSKVMVFGESAGGLNIGNLLTSPLASGLFQRACIESAAPVVNDYEDAKQKGESFVNGFINSGSNSSKISFMRSLPADSLVNDLENPTAGGFLQMNWQPVVDGIVFPDFPINRFQSGNFNKVPLIIGTNADEMSLSAPATVYPFMVNALINAYVPVAYQSQALQLYPPGSTAEEARKSYVALLSDAQFNTSVRRTAQCISINQNEPVWRYFFTHRHTFSLLEPFGSYHGMELFYVFNNWENTILGSGVLFKPADDSVQKNMLAYWTNFASTGNPNAAGLVSWPKYNSETDCYLNIKATPDGSQTGIRTAECDLWDTIAGYDDCTSSLSVNELYSGDAVVIYPNPGNGILYIKNDLIPEHFSAIVYDESGRVVLRTENQAVMDFSKYKPGLYFVRIFIDRKVYVVKYLKIN